MFILCYVNKKIYQPGQFISHALIFTQKLKQEPERCCVYLFVLEQIIALKADLSIFFICDFTHYRMKL